MQYKDYYKTLGVKKDASDKEIKQAYRKLARKHHPDVNPGNKQAEERFKEISNAFQVLSDDEKRRLYDRYGPEGPGMAGFSGFTNVQDIFSSFGDLFGDLFGFGSFGNFGRTRRSRGADLEVDLVLVHGHRQPRRLRTKSCSTRNFSNTITPLRLRPNSPNSSRRRPRRVT